LNSEEILKTLLIAIIGAVIKEIVSWLFSKIKVVYKSGQALGIIKRIFNKHFPDVLLDILFIGFICRIEYLTVISPDPVSRSIVFAIVLLSFLVLLGIYKLKEHGVYYLLILFKISID